MLRVRCALLTWPRLCAWPLAPGRWSHKRQYLKRSSGALTHMQFHFLHFKNVLVLYFIFLRFAAKLYKLYSYGRGDICRNSLATGPKSQASIWSTWRQSLICFRTLFFSFLYFFFVCHKKGVFFFCILLVLLLLCVLVTRHLVSLCIFIEFWPGPQKYYTYFWSTASTGAHFVYSHARQLHTFCSSITDTHTITHIPCPNDKWSFVAEVEM